MTFNSPCDRNVLLSALRSEFVWMFALVAGALTLAALIGGCETTEGAGRDLEKLGDNIEDAASDAKD